MTGPGLIYCLVTGVSLLLFLVIFVLAVKKRPTPVPAPREPIGYLTEFSHDENGGRIKGVLNDEGMKLFRQGDMSAISIGFKQDGVMVNNASPVLDPRPCKGGNSNICVAEGCYGEACVKRWLAKRP